MTANLKYFLVAVELLIPCSHGDIDLFTQKVSMEKVQL